MESAIGTYIAVDKGRNCAGGPRLDPMDDDQGIHETIDEQALPRPQRGSESQISLLTMFANYWLHSPEWLPSAAAVELLTEYDLSPASARTALSRLTRRGVLTNQKLGRRTFYRLSPPAATVLRHRTRELLAFGNDHPWDGEWTCVAFSVPDEGRHLRPVLRADLRALGFAGLYDGLWVSPRPPGEALERAISELSEVGSVTVLRGTTIDRPGPQPIDAFDLDEVRDAYESFLGTFASARDDLEAGDVTLRDALVQRTLLMNDWRRLNRLDPDLPSDLLPDDWPRADARRLFVAVHDGLAPLAVTRFDQIISNHDDSLHGLATHFTTDNPPDPAGQD